jgi:hypothetical protein
MMRHFGQANVCLLASVCHVRGYQELMCCIFTDEELAQQVCLVAQMGGTESVSQEEANDMEMALAIFKSYQVSGDTQPCHHMFTDLLGLRLCGPSCRLHIVQLPLQSTVGHCLVNCKCLPQKRFPLCVGTVCTGLFQAPRVCVVEDVLDWKAV